MRQDNHKEQVTTEYRKPISRRLLREQVVKRDGNMCKDCGSHTKLLLHHVFGEQRAPIGPEYRDLLSECNKPENLVLLCHSCHGKRHTSCKRFRFIPGV